MECPKCHNKKTHVLKTEPLKTVILRTRECLDKLCKHIFETEEKANGVEYERTESKRKGL